MNLIFLVHLAVIASTLILGLLVYWTNRSRAANLCFLLLTFVLVSWLSSLASGFKATDEARAAAFIRIANMIGAMVPFIFNALRLSIVHRQHHLQFILRHTAPWLVGGLAMVMLCLTDFFLAGATINTGPDGVIGIPEPIYGPGIALYGMYQAVAFGVFIFRFVGDLKRARNIARVELQFMLLASVMLISTAFVLTILIPGLTGNSQLAELAPVSILLFVAITAFGIATRRIMNVGYVLRALIAYGLLTAYLALLYAAVFYGARFALRALGLPEFNLPPFLAALVMAFSLAPAHGRFRRVADRLFVSLPSIDVGSAVRRASGILQSIGTLNTMLEGFTRVLCEIVGAETAVILLRDGSRLVQVYPRPGGDDALPGLAAGEGGGMEVSNEDAIVRTVGDAELPVVADIIQRRTPTVDLAEADRFLRTHRMAACAAMRRKDQVRGLVFLGPRLSGGVYGVQEQRTVQALVDQLGIAVENATLYTQVEDGKLYNDILVDNLVSGVIAVDGENRITTFNREAERLTGLTRDLALNQTINVLPAPLGHLLKETLDFGIGIRNRSVALLPDGTEEAVPLRAGTGIFHGHKGAISGALLVFSDMSAVRKLEEQVRRTTHLASVGTLAGGMAHEIKNPLVTLKTFAQLLKERYDDEEFRTTFVDLVGSEVNRIDMIVNQLLRFGKPADAVLRPIELAPEIRESLRLVSGEIAKKSIVVAEHAHAAGTVINGDPRLLQQAFVNFFLNAIDAMPERGILTVTTEIIKQPPIDSFPDLPVLQDRQVSVTIRDTGKGIAPADISRVFDPFFTTKVTGTGLGLSVVHGIIREHKGIIDVESTVGVGTTFIVSFPMLRDQHPSYVRNAPPSAANVDPV